jgi:hypothetical protein
MKLWQRRRMAMIASSWTLSLVVAVVLYFKGLPYRQFLLRPLVPMGMLMLVFLPVVIGIYFGRQKKD